MKAVLIAHVAIDTATNLAKITRRRRRRKNSKTRVRSTRVQPIVTVSVEYVGFDITTEQRIEQIARTFGAEREGSGFSFADGLRDISYAFVARSELEQHSQGIVGEWDHYTRPRTFAVVDARRFISTVLGEVPDAIVCKVYRYASYER